MLVENDSFLSFIPVSSEPCVVCSAHALDVPTCTVHSFHKLYATLTPLHISEIDPGMAAVASFAFLKIFIVELHWVLTISCWCGFFTHISLHSLEKILNSCWLKQYTKIRKGPPSFCRTNVQSLIAFISTWQF